MKETRRSFLTSCTALLLCFSMLLGSTFAWFTDVVTSSGNKIVTGSLDLDLQLKDKETGSYSSINESSDPLFNYDKWEPGYTDIKVLKVANVGSLSFKWVGNFVSRETITKLAEVIDVYVKTSEADFAYPTEMTEITSANGWKNIGTLDKIIDSPTQPVSGQLLSGESDYFAVALHMQESAGNDYQDTTLGAFDIAVHAAQYTAENDSFGNDYDENAQWPSGVIAGTITASGAVATDEQGKVASEITLTSSDGKVSALLPAGTQLEAGKTNVTVIVSPVHESQANVTLGDTEKMLPVDVHIDGVAENNDVPIPVYLAEWMAVGLNIGNYHLYHVENGATNEMTLRQGSATPVHNNFDYDPATGDVTLYLASFSEVAMVADIENAWDGAMDFSWYTNASANTTTYQIANADQLAAFGAIVGGMAKDKDGNFLITYTDSDGDEHHNDNFYGKTVKLLADVNLGDKESENKSDIIFYPIGYWNSEGTYEKTGTAISSGFYAFEGTFDGNGNTVSNFYQNTWEMKGDHDWYDATLQYYRDGMGLFGKVYGGTVKNLTVNNFSCDSEIGTSGVIAAYADSKNDIPAVFENITITNCNPRVYNIGNGGIVGCAGWYSRNENLSKEDYANAVTFRNITVDQSNKISALWGSWGVSCAGILGQYYPDSNCGIKLENCHVAAIIDVNNDVCSNYQYYWYRYAGMFIGTIRANTQEGGYTVADTTGVTAKDCTYTIGEWNQYWYCEIVANSLASYTHDHQFSRLEKIASLSEIQDENGSWNREGHFVIPNADNTAAKCYHIFKNSNGELYQHFHDVADESNPNIYESFDLNGDGELNDLKEDRQCYFIPFNQLLTGLDMGIKAHTEFEGITEKKDGTVKSVYKFTAINNMDIPENGTVSIGDLFEASGNGIISSPTVQVYVSPVGYGSTVSAMYSGNSADWEKGTLTFSGTGSAKVVITDYFYCTSTVLYVTVGGVTTAYNKFDSKFTGDFLYRVGNQNAVKLDSLFKAKDGVTIGTVSVTVEAVEGTRVSGTYTSNKTWTNGTIQFSGTGVVKVTITDNDYCTPTVLYLEVVDAVNATAATDATSNNVVLLNDIGAGFTVSGRYAVYGNGFTLNYTGNGQYLNNGLKQGIVTVKENGTLDNLRIVASIYPTSYLYYDEAKNGPSTVDGDKTRYHYQLSAVAASDNATISNCYIYGARNNIFVNTGNVTIKDCVLECGTLANVQIQSSASHTVTFENVTTIQHQVNATIGDTSAVMMGAGIVVGPETNDNPKIIINGEFKQYNWVTTADKNAVTNSTAKTIIQTALDATAFNHTVNGATSSNLGIIYLNDFEATVTNNSGLPYAFGDVSIMNNAGKVYSLQGATKEQIYSDYANADKSTVNGWYVPQFKYPADLGGQLEEDNGGDSFLYREGDTIKVMFPSGDTKEIDLAALVNITKYTGQDLGLVITCKNSFGNAVTVTDGKITLSAADEYTVTYTVTDTLFFDKDGNTVTKTVGYSWDATVSVSLKDTAVPNAYFAYDTTKQTMGYAKKSIFAGGNTQYLPFLAGLKIYDYNGQNAYLRFDGDNDFNKIAAAEITGYTSANHVLIKVTLTDGGVINIDTTARAASGGSTYTGKLQTSGNTLYYVNDGTTSATTTTWVISSYKFTGNNGVEINSGTVTFSKCENGSVPTGSFGTTIKYTVTYNANGGDCGQTIGYATSASASVTLPTPTRSGYTFLGWYTATTGGVKVGGAGEPYEPTANITLYAQWGAPCTVTYDANGGSCATTSEKFNGKTLILPEATREGYVLYGWYTSLEGGERIGGAGDSYNPTTDITLYARWGVEYTVTYNANGGTCGTASATYQGTALTLPTPTKEGHTFLGWYTATTGGVKVGGAGESYEPTANITLYAQWQINSYTIKVTTNNATVKVNGAAVSNNGTVSIQFGAQVTVEVTYSESNERSTTITGTDGTTYTSPFKMPAQNVTINATSSGGCFTPDTLITLADGSQKRVDEILPTDKILAWDFFTGAYVAKEISLLVNHGDSLYRIANLGFSDGTELKVIAEHGIFDYDLNRFVYLSVDNMNEHIGHRFVKYAQDGSYDVVTLISAYETEEFTSAWSISSAETSNAFASGLLTVAPPEDFYNWIEMDGKLHYDVEQFQKDVETYGLYTYEDFADYVTEEQFVEWNGAYLKIAVEKGYFSFDYILELIEMYKSWMP